MRRTRKERIPEEAREESTQTVLAQAELLSAMWAACEYFDGKK